MRYSQPDRLDKHCLGAAHFAAEEGGHALTPHALPCATKAGQGNYQPSAQASQLKRTNLCSCYVVAFAAGTLLDPADNLAAKLLAAPVAAETPIGTLAQARNCAFALKNHIETVLANRQMGLGLMDLVAQKTARTTTMQMG